MDNIMTIPPGGTLTAFKDLEQMFRVSDYLAKSNIVPAAFKGNAGSVMIALNTAQRLAMDPLMIMQNIVIVNGNATLSGKFAIALLNRSPKYKRIEYKYINGKDYTGGMQVIGYRKDDPNDKHPDVGSPITLELAEKEGWSTKAGSKWKTMPDQMMRYRAAAFFARAFVPEALLGMQMADEAEDIAPQVRDVTPRSSVRSFVPAPNIEQKEVPSETPQTEAFNESLPL